jgi:hypothetical protein
MRVAAAVVLGLVLAAATPVAAASHHHHASSSHKAKTNKSAKHSTKPATHHADAAPKGVIPVPAAGVKLSCGAGRNPLLVRKMTQGAGTTVTVICR